MKTTFDFTALDGILKDFTANHAEVENRIKEEIKKCVMPSSRECFFSIPVSGNRYNAYAFESVECIIHLKLERICSTKTWKPIKDNYTVDGYRIDWLKRDNIYADYKVTRIQKRYYKDEITCITSEGIPC